MNFYIERVQGLCNVNVISASQNSHRTHVTRDGEYLEPHYGIYIIREGDVVYTPLIGEAIYVAQTAGQDGCLDHNWTVMPNGCPVAGDYPRGATLYWDTRDLHLVAKALYMDDILASTVMDECNWAVDEGVRNLERAFSQNGNLYALYDDIPAPEALHNGDS